MSKIENGNYKPGDIYPQYEWNSIVEGFPDESFPEIGWCKAYTFNDDGERIATSLYYGGIDIYQLPVWKERTLPLTVWNNLVTHWAPLDQDTINQHPLVTDNILPLPDYIERWYNAAFPVEVDDEDVNDSDEDIDDWTTNNEWVNARPVGREFGSADWDKYTDDDLKNELDSMGARRSHGMYNPFEYPGHDLNNSEDTINNNWVAPERILTPEEDANGRYHLYDEEADPTSEEWQACNLLIAAGYRGHKSCYTDQGGDWRLTPHRDIDKTEQLELATGTPNHLAQILTLENYIRNPNNGLLGLWEEAAKDCNDPVKDEYGHGIDLIQLHDARYRTVINCCRILARQAEDDGDDTQMSEAERFNEQCAQFIKDWNDGVFIVDMDSEYFNPYNDMNQLALVMQVVSAVTGRAFIFDQGDFEMSMIRYVMEYADEKYAI